MNTIIPVILVGGSGTRLWPMSRANDPKQFAVFSGEFSLFQQTLLRVCKIHAVEKIVLVVGESNYFLCLEQLRELSIDNVDIIVEPMGRNTAAAVAVAANYIRTHIGDNRTMLVLPSDHQIKSVEKFAETVKGAAEKAEEKLVLFGVKPVTPCTAYGYIQVDSSDTFPAKVSSFIEKPNLEKAKALIAQDNYYWNSGMFFFSVASILREFSSHANDIGSLATLAIEKSLFQGNTCYLHRDTFSAMPTIPLDIAIMEKTTEAFLYPLQSDWSDLGDWEAIYQSHSSDENHNVSIGDVVSLSTTNSYLHSKNALLTTIGVDNLVVVSTKDSVLIANRNHVQDVKALVEKLKSSNYAPMIENNVKVFRPWGSYESVVDLDNFKVKHIVVKPGGKLSLQKHQHRSEHWVVVRGIADVVCGEAQYQIGENESTYIPKETKHRLLNLQETPLHLIEVQVGAYLGEDDIVRFDDVYGRSKVEI